MSEPKINATRLLPETLAKLLSAASKRDVSVDKVERVAKDGNLIGADGTIDFLEYLARLLTTVE